MEMTTVHFSTSARTSTLTFKGPKISSGIFLGVSLRPMTMSLVINEKTWMTSLNTNMRNQGKNEGKVTLLPRSRAGSH